MVFGLITEGPTDQVVLRHLLSKYFSDPDIDTRPVQPSIDETDRVGAGGWQRVLGYCKSTDFVAAIQANDFVVIQMDTDCCEDYGVRKREGDRDISGEEIVVHTQKAIIEQVGTQLYEEHKSRIIFAISHELIECWLLPFYYDDNSRTKTFNCCEKLNQGLPKGSFTIDCSSKQTKYYERIFKEKKDKIRNKAMIENIAVHNHSFNQFIQRLASI